MARTSIFTNGYIPTSKCAKYGDAGYKNKAYLQWNTLTFNNLGFSAPSDGALWEMIITDIMEKHGDLCSRHTTLAGTVCYFATGPGTIQLTITAQLPVSNAADYRIAFLYQYIKNLRAKQLDYNDCLLTLVLKDTATKIYINNIQLAESATITDMITIVISCLAYRYSNTSNLDSNLSNLSVSASVSVSSAVGSPSVTIKI